MDTYQNESSSMPDKINNVKEYKIPESKVKKPYSKPIIKVYSKEGKDFWCD